MDKIIRAVSSDGYVRISAVTARGVVQRAREIHDTSPVATAALGRALCAASMMGEMLKEEKASLTIRIKGGGPIGSIVAVSDSSGNVRGYVQHPHVDLPLRPDGKLDVGGAVGKNGTITVSRDFGLKEPYIGSTTLVSGEIAEDVTAYFAESEQVGTACGLGVLVDTDLSVRAAGGFLVQLMPGAPDELIDRLEENIRRTEAVTEMLTRGGAEAIIQRILEGFEPRVLEELPIEYRCYCSRERVLQAVSVLSREELQDIVEKGEETTVSCQFCDAVYRFSPEEIKELL
jgi:molecular chaperone Hsp33